MSEQLSWHQQNAMGMLAKSYDVLGWAGAGYLLCRDHGDGETGGGPALAPVFRDGVEENDACDACGARLDD